MIPPASAPAPAPSAAPTELPTLRRLPLPVSEPPYDDEVSARAAPPAVTGQSAGQTTLGLAFVLPSGLPARPEVQVRSRGERGWRSSDGDAAADTDAGRVTSPAPRKTASEVHLWAARLLQAVVEVLCGDRPVGQLVRWTDEEVYATLQRRMRLSQVSVRAGGALVDGASGGNAVFVRAALARHAAPAVASGRVRPVVRSVHVSEPATGVAEVCALVQWGPRARAIALRLEGGDGRWQCTALEIG